MGRYVIDRETFSAIGARHPNELFKIDEKAQATAAAALPLSQLACAYRAHIVAVLILVPLSPGHARPAGVAGASSVTAARARYHRERAFRSRMYRIDSFPWLLPWQW
jgi:hypothetical protein